MRTNRPIKGKASTSRAFKTSHTRHYSGGDLDGRTELVEGLKVKPWVDKPEWARMYGDRMGICGKLANPPIRQSHFYVLTEPPPKKGQNQGVYIYEYQPDFVPPMEAQQLVIK